MFDEIDAAYYRQRASEERDRAAGSGKRTAERCMRRAAIYQARADALSLSSIPPRSQL